MQSKERRMIEKKTHSRDLKRGIRKRRGITSITYYGQYYRVPDEYIGRRVWTKLKGETLFIESAKKVIAKYQIKHDRLDEPR